MNERVGIILTPWWNSRDFHPHQRRLRQWIDTFESCGLFTVIIGLGEKKFRKSYSSGELLIERHPRLLSNQTPMLGPKTLRNSYLSRVLAELVQNTINSYNPRIILFTNPYLISIVGDKYPKDRTIVDVMDVIVRESCNFREKSVFSGLLTDRNIAVLSEREYSLLENHDLNTKRTHVVEPALRQITELYSTERSYVSLWGRASRVGMREICWFARNVSRLMLARGLLLPIIVVGGISQGLRSTSSFLVAGPQTDLRSTLHRGICILPPPISISGMSFRILDALEALSPIVAHPSVLRGYSLEPMKMYLPANTSNEFVDAIEWLHNNPGPANTIAQNAEGYARSRLQGTKHAQNLVMEVVS